MQNEPVDYNSDDLHLPVNESVAPQERQRLKNAARILQMMRSKISRIEGVDTASEKDEQTQELNCIANVETWKQNQNVFAVSDAAKMPRQFGRFKIIDKLGEGGFAAVYLAFDDRLNRNVALKIPKPGRLCSAVERERFDREAKAAALLNHPNIVPVLETDRVGPVQYIASLYCDGPTLSQWMNHQSEPIDQRLAAEILIQLAEAVAHAHQRGILHRDLKPGNVLIEKASASRGQDSWVARITDFGLAKQVESVAEALTVDNAIVGTPVYMSPEQARGLELSYPSDLYSLGVILYELLTGEVPHKGPTHLETLQCVANHQAKPPRKIRPAVSRDLEAICLKAISNEAALRYQSGHDLAQDLRNWIDGNPIQARRAGPLQVLTRWSNKNRALSSAVGLLIGSLSLGVLLTFWQYSQSQNNLRQSVLQGQRAASHILQLENVVDFILAEFGSGSEVQGAPTESELRVLNRMLDVHRGLIQDEADHLNVDVNTVDNYIRVAKIFSLLGDYGKSVETIDTLIELFDATEFNLQADGHLKRKKLEAAFQAFLISWRHGSDSDIEARLDYWGNVIDEQNPLLSGPVRWQREYDYWRFRGLAEARKQDFLEAETAFLKAHETLELLAESKPGDGTLQTMKLRSMLELADNSWALKRREDAIEFYQNLIELFHELPQNQQKMVGNIIVLADCQSNLGHALTRRRSPEQAKHVLDDGAETYQRIEALEPGTATDRHAHLLVRIARLCLNQKWYRQGIEACDDGLALLATVPPSRFKTKTEIEFLSKRAELRLCLDENTSAAETDLRNAIAMGENAIGKYPDAGAMYAGLGISYFYLAQHFMRNEEDERAMANFDLALTNIRQCHRRQNFRSSPKVVAIKATIAKSDYAIAQGKLGTAMDCWTKLAEIRPDESLFYTKCFTYFSRKLKELDDTKFDREMIRDFALDNLELALQQGSPSLELDSHRDAWRGSQRFEKLLRLSEINRPE